MASELTSTQNVSGPPWVGPRDYHWPTKKLHQRRAGWPACGSLLKKFGPFSLPLEPCSQSCREASRQESSRCQAPCPEGASKGPPTSNPKQIAADNNRIPSWNTSKNGQSNKYWNVQKNFCALTVFRDDTVSKVENSCQFEHEKIHC